jgi:UDP-2,3-diacylglucosamine pyrophosphatase LpxH
VQEKSTTSDYCLFILGDLWDYWRNHNVIFSPVSDTILSLVNRFKEVYYVPGNHDHIVLRATQDYPDFNCYNISRYFRVKSGDKSFFMLHGHELEVISKLVYLTVEEYDNLSDQLCRMNDQEGKMASYLHEAFHKLVPGRQIEMGELIQPAEERRDMDSIDKFAKSKAKYPLLGMQLHDILIFGHTHRAYADAANNVINTGAWISDMLVPQWFKDHYGSDKKCSGWYVKIEKGNYELLPYEIQVEKNIQRTKDDDSRLHEPFGANNSEADRQDADNHDNNKDKPITEKVVERITQQTSEFVSDLLGKKPKEKHDKFSD